MFLFSLNEYLEVDHTPIIMTNNVFYALSTIDEYNLNKRKEATRRHACIEFS